VFSAKPKKTKNGYEADEQTIERFGVPDFRGRLQHWIRTTAEFG
jgi:hypothetical protein